ncbi:MAG: glycoside hydrolase family 99-like domain-containing protein [Deltaproteobacteria bacterium]|nr:glycoside hydrolase family 99-like domain-containing protein [Deltaproteobacteria bacterium]
MPELDPTRYKSAINDTDSNSSHTHIVRCIQEGTRVLDVGCSCGDLGIYLHHKKSCRVWGMEYAQESVAIAKASQAYDHVAKVDLNIFDDYESYYRQGFDYIVFGDVLEHLYAPAAVLRNFIPALNPGGRMIVSLPNVAHGSIAVQVLAQKFDYMDYGILDRTHLRFFTAESIANLFSELGLEVMQATHTIWDLPGLHPYDPTKLVHPGVLGCVAANPLSYVLQYISTLQLSALPAQELHDLNLKRLSALTEPEMRLMWHYRSKLVPDTQGGVVTSPTAGVTYSLLRFKPFIRKYLPRPLWNLLKNTRNAWRNARFKKEHRMEPSTDQNTDFQIAVYALSEYRNQVQKLPEKMSPCFVDISSKMTAPQPDAPKAIAFYLPQFHTFPENDAWWGRGFTEWTNVVKTVPLFVGHHQPQLPIDLGLYDLRVPEVMHRQVELAKQYGIYGFCFHYYWFSGKRMMEKPVFDYLADKNLDLPFCFCWANEPWSRRWDGSEDDLLIGQNLQPEDDQRFIEDMLPFLQDTRYITIDGRPALIIYRPHYWRKSRVLTLTDNFRKTAKKHGLPGLFLITALSHDFHDDPRDWGFDAGVEFPPHKCGMTPGANNLHFVCDSFSGSVHDTRFLVDAEEYMKPSVWTTFKTAFPAWDNTARKNKNALIFHHTEPPVYKKWLKNILDYTHAHNPPEQQFVFINAWNEWAEGAHLEPDKKYGYAFLQATAEALEEFTPHSDSE